MPYSNKQMLRDANGDLIPQYWDVVEQDFKPLTGQGGANDVRLTGSIKEEIVSDLFDDIPAGTRHFAYIDVPNGYNALTVMCRTLEGKIESIGIIPSVNSLGWSRFRKILEVYANAEMPNDIVFTEKVEVTTKQIRLEVVASQEGDVIWNPSGGLRGVRIFWHKD